jgi:hypothetical protein
MPFWIDLSAKPALDVKKKELAKSIIKTKYNIRNRLVSTFKFFFLCISYKNRCKYEKNYEIRWNFKRDI